MQQDFYFHFIWLKEIRIRSIFSKMALKIKALKINDFNIKLNFKIHVQ